MFGENTKNFWILSGAMFLFMTSFNLILPELNTFITELGGGNQKGLIITLFTISAAISRPFSGKLSDTIGRKKVMIIGIIICFIVSLLYPLSFSIWFFLILRFLHGFSAGFLPTGATALVTDILPKEARGRGMGIWGTFISLGIGVGQALGDWLFRKFGMDNLFLFAAITALFAGFLIAYVKETLEKKQKFKFNHLSITIKDVFEPSVLPAAFVMFLTASCSGIIFVLTPDISDYLGINNKGWFFGIYVLSTIVIRLFTSSLSDKIGRRKTLLIGVIILIASMFLIGTAHDITAYTTAAVLFGVATGITSPTLFAWTADLSHIDRRGVGSGTMFIALELGIMLGSISTIFTYNNHFETIYIGFSFGILMSVLAAVFLIWHLTKRKSLT
ncbi:MAG: MFS transporter [Crocinitomicaceae bacterium]|nr:MFS transporter [Crocinitomicaceae bacterium]